MSPDYQPRTHLNGSAAWLQLLCVKCRPEHAACGCFHKSIEIELLIRIAIFVPMILVVLLAAFGALIVTMHVFALVFGYVQYA